MGLTASNHAGFFSPAFEFADRLIAYSLAALLLPAAVLKAIRGESPIALPLALELLVFIEIAAALLLVFHRSGPFSRLTVAVLFAILAIFALAAALRPPRSNLMRQQLLSIGDKKSEIRKSNRPLSHRWLRRG